MHLSACLIARNEANNIARAIESVRRIADEVIVTDTGSTDDTVQIAEKLGARVELFSWCDDFSAARNHALDRASGEWVLWIDADEELLADSIPALQRCIADDNALAWHVQRQDLVEPGNLDDFSIMWQLRLFRNRPELRFIGRCHPHFDPPEDWLAGQLGMTVLGSDVTLRHYGYFAELRPAKVRRGLRLIDLELADRPGQLYYLIEKARGLHLIGDEAMHGAYLDAAAAVAPHLDDQRPPLPLVAMLLEYLLQVPDERQPPGWSLDRVRELCQRWFPDAAPLLWIEAHRLLGEQQFEPARKLFAKLVRLGEHRTYDYSIGFAPHIVGDDARLNLAVTLVRLGELHRAEAQLKRLIDSPTRSADAKQNLAVIRDLKRGRAKPRSRRPGSRRR